MSETNWGLGFIQACFGRKEKNMATAEELDSRCTVNFIGTALMENNPLMTAAVLQRLPRYLANNARINVYIAERDSRGWLEWQLHIYREDGRLFVLGAIQRTPDADVEFHS